MVEDASQRIWAGEQKCPQVIGVQGSFKPALDQNYQLMGKKQN